MKGLLRNKIVLLLLAVPLTLFLPILPLSFLVFKSFKHFKGLTRILALAILSLLLPISLIWTFAMFSPSSSTQDVKGEKTTVTPSLIPTVSQVPVTTTLSLTGEIKPGESAKVIKVVDGDTIALDNGKTLRYIGIDTPETVDPRSAVQCFGAEASAKNKELVLGKTVRLEKDVSETDQFGRLLRYVYIDDESGKTVFVNEYLVKEGYAYASSYLPDVKRQKQLQDAQTFARTNNKGLWSKCVTTPTPTTKKSVSQAEVLCLQLLKKVLHHQTEEIKTALILQLNQKHKHILTHMAGALQIMSTDSTEVITME